MITDVRRAA